MSATSWSQTKLNGPSDSRNVATNRPVNSAVIWLSVPAPRMVPGPQDELSELGIQPARALEQRLDRGLVPGVGELGAAGDRRFLGERAAVVSRA